MARDPKAEVEISAHSRGLAGRLREARAKFGRFGAELKKDVFGKDLVEKGFWGKGGASLVGNLGASAVGFGLDVLVDGARRAHEFQKQLTRLQLASGKTPEEMQAFGRAVLETSDATGIGSDRVLAAAKAYVALTGDMDGAITATRQFARVAQATDSEVTDIGETAAALKKNLKIDPKDWEAAFSALSVQGKAGAIEIKDLASQLSNIAPMWTLFKGGSGLGGLRELGAALQVVKGGFGGDASQTVTGLQSMLVAFKQNERHFRRAGVKIFDVGPGGVKSLRGVFDIVRDIGNSKLAKDPTALVKAFGRVEAERAYQQLVQNRDELEKLVDLSGDTSAIGRDFDTYMASPAGRMARSMEAAKNALVELFTPERIDTFAGALAKAIDLFGRMVDFAERGKKFIDDIRDNTVDYDEQKWIDDTAKGYANQKVAPHMLASPEERLRMADVFDQVNTDEWKRMAAGGEHSRTDKALARSNMIAALTLRESAMKDIAARDVWQVGDANGSDRANFALAYANDRSLAPAASGLREEIAKAIRDGFKSIGGITTTVQIDKDTVAQANRNAPSHRSRPGG